MTDLIQQFRDGDPHAFEQIVGRFQQPLVQFFFRLCWDRDRSEDLVQDVFLRVLRGSRHYVPQGKLSTFLFRIASNLWIDQYRAMRPRPVVYSLDQVGLPADQAGVGLDHLAGPDASPERLAEDAEEKRMLRRALDRLTEPHRLVFELAVYQALPYEEVAETLGIPVGTVKSRMHKIVHFLKDALGNGAAAHAAPRATGTDGPPPRRMARG
jgi:RNA polymerase sigma-70 factor (ECF subfamily)